jgi:hypothetical protein
MGFRDCVNRGIQDGSMPPAKAQRIIDEYEEHFGELEGEMGPSQADYEAARRVIATARAAAKERRRVAQLQAETNQRAAQRLQEWVSLYGRADPGDGVQAILSRRRGAKGQTVEGLYESVRRAFRREMTDAMVQFRARLTGQRPNKKTLDNVVRELFGEGTGDAVAKGIAESFTTVAERARTRFNAAGGHIGKLERWALPQTHDAAKVRRTSREEWTAYIDERLDWDAIAVSHNDGVRFTQAQKRSILEQAYQDIRTSGYSKREPGAHRGSAKYNRRADHRFFQFKNADAWQEYNAQFGSGRDAFRVMLGHLDGMASDIAQMEMLGPNPTHGFAYIKDVAMDLAQRSRDPKAPNRAATHLKQADYMFDMLNGTTNIPVNERAAYGLSAIRSGLTAAHLGSAVISSVTDFNTNRLAASFVGMNQAGFLKQMRRLMTDGEFREDANRIGLIFENAVDQGNAVARYELENVHVEATARLADFTIRASGLGYLTEVQRQSFGLEFMSTMASKWRSQSWEELGTTGGPIARRMNARFKRAMEEYGWDAESWEVLRNAGTHELRNGLEVVRAQDIEALGSQRVADLYMETITQMTEFAVPSSDTHSRAMVLSGTQPGTIGGELIRAGLQFKAFPLTMMTTQISRVMNEWNQGRKLNAVGYGASLFIGSTILGATALWMKDIVAGRDPREATTPQFWMAAMSQGGGLGLFGDFFFSDVNRFGGGVGSSLGGPLTGFIDDTFKLTVGNVQEVAQGETLTEANAGRELVRYLERYTPGSSLWYARLALEREVFDRLQALVDPNASRSFSAQNRYPSDIGTQFFAPPGERLFDARPPDLSNIIERRAE